MQTELEYATKLSAYYFDAKRETTYVILKIRNKRAVSHLSIHDVLKNKEALDSLHPIDLCIIGVLANKNSKDTVSEKPTILPDDFLMMKIPPVIEIICRDYQDGHEIYTLELKQINKKIKITPSELYENQDLLNALKYQDALALGYSIGEPPQFLNKKISRSDIFSDIGSFILNNVFVAFLILSIIVISKKIEISFFDIHFNIDSEIIFFSFLISIMSFCIEKQGISNAYKLFTTSIVSLLIFILYFGVICKLAFPTNNQQTIAFNNLYHFIRNNSLNYTVCIIFTFFIMTSNFLSFKEKLNISTVNRNIYLMLIYISIFFIFSKFISLFLGKSSYSLIEYVYSISISIVFFWIFNKLIFAREKIKIISK